MRQDFEQSNILSFGTRRGLHVFLTSFQAVIEKLFL